MSKKTDQIKFMQAMFPNAKFVECKYIKEGDVKENNTFCNQKREENNTFCNLTEQWKRGELESGLFYVKKKNNDKPIVAEYDKETCFYTFRSIFRDLNRGEIEEVLAPVPSWEEYLESESHCAVYSEVNQVLKKENRQLKFLLKECRNILEDEGWYLTVKKIDEVLK